LSAFVATFLRSVRDQRRQQAGGAEASMRLRDAPHRRHRRIVVEQDAAAAIDLYVDEARREDRIVGQSHAACGECAGLAFEVHDAATRTAQQSGAVPADAIEQPLRQERCYRHAGRRPRDVVAAFGGAADWLRLDIC
jgi:hypothetical protein